MNKRVRSIRTFCLLGSAGIALACTIHKYEQPPPTATTPPPPAPAPEPAPTTTTTAPSPVAYDPCGGKKCGDTCSVCDPNDKNCVETAVVKQCSATLTCEATPAQCTTTATAEYSSCAGKRCGERCTLCKPGDLKCRESPLVKLCHAGGQCKEATVADCANK
jgi:hypothetical protein